MQSKVNQEGQVWILLKAKRITFVLIILAEIKLHTPHNCMWRDIRIYEQVDECFCACQYKRKIQSLSGMKI